MWKTYTKPKTGLLVYYPFPEKAELMFISKDLTPPQDCYIDCDKANEIVAKIYPLIIKHTHLQKCNEKRRLLL